MTDINHIRADADYHAALKGVELLMTAKPGTLEGEKLDILVTLIETYEHKHFALNFPDPVEAIKFKMKQKDLTIRELEPMIGKNNRVYEVLNRKRALTLRMIQKLYQEIGYPC